MLRSVVRFCIMTLFFFTQVSHSSEGQTLDSGVYVGHMQDGSTLRVVLAPQGNAVAMDHIAYSFNSTGISVERLYRKDGKTFGEVLNGKIRFQIPIISRVKGTAILTSDALSGSVIYYSVEISKSEDVINCKLRRAEKPDDEYANVFTAENIEFKSAKGLLSNEYSLTLARVITSLASVASGDEHGSAEESYEKGIELAIQGNFSKASSEFQTAAEADAIKKVAKQNQRIVEDATKGEIGSETAYEIFKGIAHATKKEYDLAINYYSNAIQMTPDYAAIFQKRGDAYNYSRQPDKAITDYSKAIKLNPEDSDVYFNRGFTYELKGEHDRAISDYTKAIEFDPNNANAYKYRGTIYFVDLNSHAKGCADWKMACELGRCANYKKSKQNGLCK